MGGYPWVGKASTIRRLHSEQGSSVDVVSMMDGDPRAA